MRKVIDMLTKEPMKEFIFEEKSAEELIIYLMNFKVNDPEVTHNERYMIHKVINFVEGASGLNATEVLEKKGA